MFTHLITMTTVFIDLQEARAKAIEFAAVEFVRTFTEEYDRLAKSGAVTEEEILQGYSFAKCILLLNAEGYAPRNPKEMLDNLRKF